MITKTPLQLFKRLFMILFKHYSFIKSFKNIKLKLICGNLTIPYMQKYFIYFSIVLKLTFGIYLVFEFYEKSRIIDYIVALKGNQ